MPNKKRDSPFKYQTRSLKCFPNEKGYVIGSTEGRVGVEYFDPAKHEELKYSFKCHRLNQDGNELIFPVNCIAFHSGYGTFATGGCDGVINIWDGESKKKTAHFPGYPTSISSLDFSPLGDRLVIASSYTFEEGEKDHPADQIFIRTIKEKDVKKKGNINMDT